MKNVFNQWILKFALILITAYTMAKYGMSMCVLGMADEYKSEGVAVNALWPRTGKKDYPVFENLK